MAETLVPGAVARARDACAGLSEMQRLALAMELVRDVSDAGCAFHLMRLERLAGLSAQQLVRARFERECI